VYLVGVTLQQLNVLFITVRITNITIDIIIITV